MPRWERTASKAVSLVGMDALTSVKAILARSLKEHTREDIRKVALARGLRLTLHQIQIAIDWYMQEGSISSDRVFDVMLYKWVGTR